MTGEFITTPWFLWLSASMCGYLLGSVSFSWLLPRLAGRSAEVKQIKREIPDTDIVLESNVLSATQVSEGLGRRFGCLVSLLDMAKAAIPTAAFLLIFGERYFLAAAFATMLGHNYPLYHKFRGGRGLSPLIGGLAVINWYGLLLACLAAFPLGFLTGSALVIRWSWMFLLMLWFPLYFRDPYMSVYMAASTFLFFFSMRKELATGMKISGARKSSQEEVSEFMLMGRGLGRAIDRFGLPALLRKLVHRFRGGRN